jgi:hypothetical protein
LDDYQKTFGSKLSSTSGKLEIGEREMDVSFFKVRLESGLAEWVFTDHVQNVPKVYAYLNPLVLFKDIVFKNNIQLEKTPSLEDKLKMFTFELDNDASNSPKTLLDLLSSGRKKK